MKHIVVLGGQGFVGTKVVEALRAVPDVRVTVASRKAALVVDVTKPDTFDAIPADTDLVIDVSDATTQRPDAFILRCLERGLTVLEATSDAPCIERLHATCRARTTGRLVLGGGIFTGMSNLLGRAVCEATPGADTLTLGISASPFSGAGTGTIALMVKALAVAAVRFVRGHRVEVPTIEPGPRLDFGAAKRATLRTSLAEVSMFHESLKVPNVDAYLAPKPSLLASAFLLTPAALMTSRLGQWLLRGYFTFLRRVLLRSVPTSVEMVAIATNAARTTSQVITARDGMSACAWALAALSQVLLESQTSWSGVRFIDELTSLAAVVARANALADEDVFVLEARHSS